MAWQGRNHAQSERWWRSGGIAALTALNLGLIAPVNMYLLARVPTLYASPEIHLGALQPFWALTASLMSLVVFLIARKAGINEAWMSAGSVIVAILVSLGLIWVEMPRFNELLADRSWWSAVLPASAAVIVGSIFALWRVSVLTSVRPVTSAPARSDTLVRSDVPQHSKKSPKPRSTKKRKS